MNKWTSTTHTIADILEWSNENKLVIQPAYQRNTVWNIAAKIMLIDSIISDIPIPKIFIAKTLNKEQKPIRRIIDGQQRITSILQFLNNEFKLQKPYSGVFEGFSFSDLPIEIQDKILQYNIDINEITNPTDEQEREVYSRINKYTTPLNQQELRQAEFPGDFLTLAREIAANEFWDNYRFFTPGAIRRNLDVEFISETIILLMDGIQDKKTMLDDYYYKYMKMGNIKQKIKDTYFSLIEEIKILLDGILNYEGELLEIYKPENPVIKKSRFTQLADFYSLLHAIQKLSQKGGSLKNKNIENLIEDLVFLELEIAPESCINILKEYAVKCISQGNSASSRRFRAELLYNLLNGTSKVEPLTKDYANLLYSMRNDWELEQSQYGCPKTLFYDEYTDREFSFDDAKYIGWNKGENVYQYSNLCFFDVEPNANEYIFYEIKD